MFIKSEKLKDRKHGLMDTPKGSELIRFVKVDDCDLVEKALLENFNLSFRKRLDIGREYFSGEREMILYVFNSVVKEEGIEFEEDEEEDEDCKKKMVIYVKNVLNFSQ